MKRESAVDLYLNEARSFEVDRAEQAERSKRTAWRVAMFNGLLAVMAIGAVMGLTPLKSETLRVLRVDSSTGIVDVVPPLDKPVDAIETMTRMHLNQFVISRERYFYGVAEHDYEFVAAQQTPQLNQRWADGWSTTNPLSPLNLYKDGTTVKTVIRAISFLTLGSGKKVAQVRFTKVARPLGTGEEQRTYWVSTIEYAYTEPSKDDKLRSLNPLGFRVVEYQKEPEVAGQEAVK